MAINTIIIDAIVGASVDFGTAAYIDYKDDGQIFNGSVEWYDYLDATVLGGAAGAVVGAGIRYIAPQIGSMLSSFAGTPFTFGGGASLLSAGVTISGEKFCKVLA